MYSLSEREINVLFYVTRGLSNDEIGEILSVSKHTIKAHVSAIIRKMSAKDRTEAAYIAGKHNLV